MPTDDYEGLEAFGELDIANGDTRRLGNVLMAQLWPLTGRRATGQALVFATGADVTLPKNSYAVAVRNAQAFEQQIAKVAANPETEEPHQKGGDWTVTQAGTLVTFKSNVGGDMMNWPPGTILRLIPPVAGINPVCEVQKPGFSGGTIGIVKQVVQYDDMPNNDAAKAMLQAKLGAFPAIMVSWIQSTPVEGRTYGLSQGATRKGRDVRVYYENFAIYIIANSALSGEQRKAQGVNIMNAVQDLLGDYNRNFDGEYMSLMGTGVEMQDAKRLARVENSLIIFLTCRMISTKKRVEFRTFQPWNTTRYKSFQKEEPPNNPQELVTGDQLDPMPD